MLCNENLVRYFQGSAKSHHNATAAGSKPGSRQSSWCMEHLPFLSPSQVMVLLCWLSCVEQRLDVYQNNCPERRRIRPSSPQKSEAERLVQQ